MRKSHRLEAAICRVTLLTAGLIGITVQPSADAAALKSARVTQVVRDVKLLPSQAAPKPAEVNDNVPEDAAVRTGVESRAELTFSDLTLARLGPQTIFSSEGTRAIDLGSGAIFLHVPKNAGGAVIKTAVVTAAVTGTTLVLETFNFPGKLGPVAAADINPEARYKLTVLEGEVRLCRVDRPKDCVTVKGGQTVTGDVNGFQGAPFAFNLGDWMNNNILITGFAPLSQSVLVAIGPGVPFGVNTSNTNGSGLGSINPSNISPNSSGVSENESQETICHSGTTLVLPKSVAEKHLANHSQDSRGPCH